MDEEEDEYLRMENFETLKAHLKIDCSKFLGSVIQLWYQNVEILKRSDTFQKLENKSQQEIARKNSFVLSIPVLCDVLIKRNSESEDECKCFHDDVSRLRDLWIIHVVSNDDEMISSESLQAIKRDLREIGERMVEKFYDIGNSYVTSIERLQHDERIQRETSAQIGNRNTMSISFETQTTESSFFMEQVGDQNRMIIQLEDRRQAEYLELRSSGEVQLRMVLRSSQTAEWRQIIENVSNLDLGNLNSKPVLLENDIVVDSIEKGCLVVSFNTARRNPIQECLRILFKVLFEVLDIDSTLQKFNNSEIRVSGYVYYPEQFTEGPNSQTCQKLLIVRHLSWTTTTTKCDIDVYVSELLKNLMQGKFSTDVDERIDVQIKWDFGPDVGVGLRQISQRKDIVRMLTNVLNMFPLEIKSLTTAGNPVHLTFKCTGKMAYLQVFEENGPLVKITKSLFSDVSDTTLRLSVFVDTNFVNDSVPDSGLVFYLNPLSKISDAVSSKSFSHIITAMLEGKDHTLLKNIKELKVKAILEYREEKVTHLEQRTQTQMKYQQLEFEKKVQVKDDKEFDKHLQEGKDYSGLRNVEKLKDKEYSEDREERGTHFEQREQIRINNQQLESNARGHENNDQECINDLFAAYDVGNPNLVIRLLQAGVNPNIRNEKFRTPLHLASEHNLQRVVEKLIDHGAEINVTDENQETPLFIASRFGHWKVIDLLLEKGADPEVVNLKNQTPLYIAAKHNWIFALLQLLKFGANVNNSDNDQFTPLHVACKTRNYDVAKYLLAYGADVHTVDKYQNTPLHSTLLGMTNNERDTGIIEELLLKGTLVNKRNINWKTPLCIAAEKGLVNATYELLKAEADVNLTDSENNLPLHIACQNYHLEIAQELLKISDDVDRCNSKRLTPRMLAKGVKVFTQMFEALDIRHEYIGNLAFKFAKQGNINELLPILKQREYLKEKDSQARSLLYVASWNGHIDIVRLLIKSNADVNECDFIDRSPLSVAAEHKYYFIVELLLNFGADANIVDKFGKTALHYAIKSGSPEIASVILQHGPLAYKADKEGKTPLHFCGIFGNVNVTNVLLCATGDINLSECDINCSTPLHETIKSEQLDVAELLLRLGAKPSGFDKNGRSPLHIAAEIGSISAIDILLRFGGEINQCNEHIQTPIHLAALNGKSALKALIKHGADINIRDFRGRTPLHASLENNYVFAAKVLLKNNSCVNFADRKGTTPLHLASNLGNFELVDILLKASADANAADVFGCTPLHYCTSGAVVRLLIKERGCINYKNIDGKTPLHTAVEFLCLKDSDLNRRCENLMIMNELLQNNANICTYDNDMETVVHKSVYASNYHLVIELLSSKLCMDIRDTVTKIVYDCLQQSQNKHVTDTLEHWISIYKPNEDFSSADNVNITEKEVCPSYLYQKHEEWLRKHKFMKRANVLQRVMSIEKALHEGIKRKESSDEASLIEPMEKMLRLSGEEERGSGDEN